MMTRLRFTELEELVRRNPELDADEAMEYGDWLMPQPQPHIRRVGRPWHHWLKALPTRRHGR